MPFLRYFFIPPPSRLTFFKKIRTFVRLSIYKSAKMWYNKDAVKNCFARNIPYRKKIFTRNGEYKAKAGDPLWEITSPKIHMIFLPRRENA